VGRILDSGGLATIFARHKPSVLLHLACLAEEGQVMPHANLDALGSFIAAEWDRPVMKYIRKT
jgi:hypothetical protein